MKKSVIFRAPILSQSGYGVHARQVAKWLLTKEDLVDIKFQVMPWGNTSWIIDQNAYDGLIGKVIAKNVDYNPKQIPSQFDVSIQLQLPNEWDTRLGRYNIGMTAGVETDTCNPEWIRCCESMNEIILPSKHTEKTFQNTSHKLSVSVKTSVIPESFIDEINTCDSLTSNLPTFSTNFNFLVFGQFTGTNAFNDRKNTFFTIKWLCELFKNDPDVGIVLKTNAGKTTKIDRNIVTNLVKGIIAECRKDNVFPKIHLLHGEFTNLEVAQLYKHPQIKALVSPTRGEGFGLPLLEAAASGLPVITTEWSGHMDFMKKGKFVGLPYTLKQIHDSRIDNRIFMPGSKWAEVSEQDFKRKLSKFREASEVPKEWAKDLSAKILTEYNFDAICKQYDTMLHRALAFVL